MAKYSKEGRTMEHTPCGTVCAECEFYQNECKGCNAIKGNVFWLEYTKEPICPSYDCCVNEHKLPHCGKCTSFPCDTLKRGDPTKTDEENAALLEKQLHILRNA